MLAILEVHIFIQAHARILQVALLVNNLGSTTAIELNIITRAALKFIEGPTIGK